MDGNDNRMLSHTIGSCKHALMVLLNTSSKCDKDIRQFTDKIWDMQVIAETDKHVVTILWF